MTTRKCDKENCKDKNGNCLITRSDNLPLQCVGPWAEDKYYYLERYLNASREARRKYSDLDNAVFIDLFAGPGRCIIKDECREIESGAIRVLKREEAPFNDSYLLDIDEANLMALTARIPPEAGSYKTIKGDSNLIIKELVDKLLKHRFKRYHFVFADPFGPDDLNFETIKELVRLQRVDILIHFPIMAIRRNWHIWIKKGNTILDQFLGTNKWREEIASLPSNKVFDSLINLYEYELKKIGFAFTYDLKPVTIRNTRNAPLYDLILVSKDPLAQKIWNTTINKTPDGQKTFGF